MIWQGRGDEDELWFVRGCSVQGQVGWGFEQPGPVEGDEMIFKVPSNPNHSTLLLPSQKASVSSPV